MKRTIICISLAFCVFGCRLWNGKTYGQGEEYVSPEELNQITVRDWFADHNITPQVYAIAASRVTNKMLDATRDLYLKKAAKPTLYIAAPQRLNDQLPEGFHYAHKVTNDIIEGSRDYTIVNTPDDAEYILEILVNALPNSGSQTPIIEYQMLMSDKAGKETGSWSESIKQLQNDDQSWW